MSIDIQFLALIFIVFIFFGFFMKFLLDYRKNSLRDNLRLTSSDAWNSIKAQASALGLERSNLIYAVYQDQDDLNASIVVRNNLDQDIAKTIRPLIKRQKKLTFVNENYLIVHHLTWKKRVTFQKEGTDELLATWSEDGWFGKHKIDIPTFGTLVSSRASLDFRARFTYSLNGKVIGLQENTIDGYPKGRVSVLPDSISTTVRAFICSL